MFGYNDTILNTKGRVLWATFFFLESAFIICGNTIALLIFMKAKLSSKSNNLLISLTVADLCVGIAEGLSTLPLIVYKDGYRNDSYTLVKVCLIFTILTTFSSINLLAVIAFERVYAIIFPLKHRTCSKIHYFIAITLAVVFSLIIALVIIALEHFGPKVNPEVRKTRVNIFMMAVSLTILILIGLAYLSIWIKTRYFSFHSRNQCNSSQRNKTLAKTAFIMSTLSFVSWMPEGILIGYLTFLCNTRCLSFIPQHVFMVADVLLYGNSFVNLFVYVFRMPCFKKELYNMVSGRSYTKCGMELNQRSTCKNTTHASSRYVIVFARLRRSQMSTLQENGAEVTDGRV